MRITVEFDDKKYLVESSGLLNIRVNGGGREDIINIGSGSSDDPGEEIARIPMGGDWFIHISKKESKKETDVIERFIANYSKELLAEIEINNVKYCLYK